MSPKVSIQALDITLDLQNLLYQIGRDLGPLSVYHQLRLLA